MLKWREDCRENIVPNELLSWGFGEFVHTHIYFRWMNSTTGDCRWFDGVLHRSSSQRVINDLFLRPYTKIDRNTSFL